MMSPIQKQGYLGDISSKSTAELMDLVSRQEKILRKTKFVESLPDKGAKVRAFYEKLQQLVSERTQGVDSGDVSLQQLLSERTQGVDSGDVSLHSKQVSQHQSECDPVGGIGDKQEQSVCDSSSQNEPQQNVKIGVRNISSTEDEIRLQEIEQNQAIRLTSTSKITPSSREDSSSEMEMQTVHTGNENPSIANNSDLEESLKNMKISGQAGEVSMMERIEKEKTTNAYSKALQNATEVHIPVKLNNYLKKTKISDLPREYKFKSRDEGYIPPVHNPRAVEESAATPPSYKHKECKLISIDESLSLQKEQKVKQEELQARHAAEKLSQRLGVKMDAYNPEGVDMSYRNQDEDADSDDELE